MVRWFLLAGLSMTLSLLGGCQSEGPSVPAQAVRVEPVAKGRPVASARAEGLAAPGRQAELAFRFAGYLARIGTIDGPDGFPRPLVPGDAVANGSFICALRTKDFEHHVDEANGMSGAAAAGYGKAKEDIDQAEALYAGGAISKADLGTARARYRSVSAESATARARVASAKLALQDASLLAPFAGELLLLNAKPGVLVAPGATVAIVADLSTVRVTVSAPSEARLRVGSIVRADAGARTYSGVVRKLLPAVVGVRAASEVEVEIDNLAREIRTGALVQISFDDRTGLEPTVPIGAIVRGAGDQPFAVFVFRSENGGTVERRGVSLGTFGGGRIAVAAGLSVGEKVVVQGATLLVDGTKATVVN